MKKLETITSSLLDTSTTGDQGVALPASGEIAREIRRIQKRNTNTSDGVVWNAAVKTMADEIIDTLCSHHQAPTWGEVRKLLGAFYKTIDVMKAARNSEQKTMVVWADDMRAVEDVMRFLERLRDEVAALSPSQPASEETLGSPVANSPSNEPGVVS